MPWSDLYTHPAMDGGKPPGEGKCPRRGLVPVALARGVSFCSSPHVWSALARPGSALCSVGAGWQPGAEPCSRWGCVSAKAAVTCQAELGTGSAWRGDMLLNLEALLHSKMHFSWQLPCREAVELPCLCQDHSHFFLRKKQGCRQFYSLKPSFSS